MTPEEFQRIKERVGDMLDESDHYKKQYFLDHFTAARNDGDTIDEAIDYAVDQLDGYNKKRCVE